MEENKKSKVEMKPIPEEASSKKMSYEQLKNVASQLSAQVNQLYMKLQEANMTNLFKRLDYLFKVVENASVFDAEFADKCITEIKELMIVPAENKENKSKE